MVEEMQRSNNKDGIVVRCGKADDGLPFCSSVKMVITVATARIRRTVCDGL